MRTPTIAGQYRLIKEDSISRLFQCLWCLRTVVTTEDPQYGWHFCPKCGKSWFNRLRCRPNTVPRWHWDLYGDSGVPVQLPKPKPHTKNWHIECRSFDSFNKKWGDWYTDCILPKDTFRSSYYNAYAKLKMFRATSEPGIEYRVVVKERTDSGRV